MTEEVKPAPRPSAEALDNVVITQEMVAAWSAHDKLEEEKAAQANREERAVEEMRAAWVEENGIEPSEAEIKQALALKRQGDAAERARRNEQIASRQIRSIF